MTRLRHLLPLLLAPRAERLEQLLPRSSNMVLRAASPTGTWESVVTFTGASPSTNLWLPGAAPRAFYRVRSVSGSRNAR